ncbi:MAG: hypothetical protein IJX30_02275 [Clostridia bacterium]|nr:hypothetical protein [Clostridia bacterium]
MKKFLALIMTLGFLFSCSACGSDDKKNTGGEQSGTDNSVGSNPVVTLNSFDDQTVMNRLMLRGVLGKVELNTQDNAYIKSGVGSAKVTISAEPYKTAQPYLYQATEFFTTGEDYSDFAKAANLTLWVYNAQETTKKVGLQFVYSAELSDITQWYELAPQSWTQLRCTVAREYLTATNGEYKVEGINVVFNRGETDDVYYLDEFNLYRTDTEFTPVTMNLDEHEICSFDKYWQVRKLNVGCWGDQSLVPSVEWVKDNTATGSGGALRVITTPIGTADRWPYIVINATTFSMIDLAQYGKGDKLCFEAYAPELNGMDRIWMEMYSTGGLKYYTSDVITLKKGEWITVSIDIEKINATGRLYDTSELRILHQGYTGDNAKIFYVDNIRIEVGEGK